MALDFAELDFEQLGDESVIAKQLIKSPTRENVRVATEDSPMQLNEDDDGFGASSLFSNATASTSKTSLDDHEQSGLTSTRKGRLVTEESQTQRR
jgi:hypothetical protein